MRGHIRKRGKNSWAVVVDLGRDPQTGKRRQKWFAHKTRREAEAHLAQIVAAMQGGGWTPPAKTPLGDYLEQWLRDYAGALSPKSLYDYRVIVHKHLIPALGAVPLAVLSPQAIQGWVTRQLQHGLAPITVATHLRVLKTALNQAVRWGLLSRNPAAMVKPPRVPPPERTVWDEEAVRLFLAEAKRSSRYYPLYLTAILTGMRAGELAGLRWQDVDLAYGVASVRQTLYRLGSQVIVKEPKTRSSRRTVALPPAVVEALRALRADQEENRRLLGADYHDADLVFCQPTGKPLHLHNVVARDFREVCARAGVPRVRFHDLRHLHISHLAKAGVPVKVAQERVGHSTPHLTLQVYSHVLGGQHEQAARTIEAHLLGRLVQEGAG